MGTIDPFPSVNRRRRFAHTIHTGLSISWSNKFTSCARRGREQLRRPCRIFCVLFLTECNKVRFKKRNYIPDIDPSPRFHLCFLSVWLWPIKFENNFISHYVCNQDFSCVNISVAYKSVLRSTFGSRLWLKKTNIRNRYAISLYCTFNERNLILILTSCAGNWFADHNEWPNCMQ